MTWFKEGLSPYQTGVAMVGIKPGGVVVVLGAGDGGLAAELALLTGLNGRTIVVDDGAAAKSVVDAAAARAGALVEFVDAHWAALPWELEGADVAVVQCRLGSHPADGPAILSEAARVIRPGGRVVVVEGAARKGMLASLRRSAGPAPLDGARLVEMLALTSLRAARVLGEENGVTYAEGVKARPDGAT
jgi:ubiquinone/menaquinone biosynthesis C-methylase UbiE